MVTGQAPQLKTWGQVKAVNNAYNEEIAQAKQRGTPVVWHTAMFPPELIQAYDVVNIGGEWYGSICGFAQDISLVETAEHCGFPHETCSYARMCFGSMITGRGFLGEFPEPAVVLGQEGICNVQTKWFEIMARYCNVPFFVIDGAPVYLYDLPNWGEQAERDAVEYVVQQEYRFLDFMERAIGQRPSEERMIETFLTARRNSDLWDEVMELWRASPSPISVRSLFTYENPIVSLPCKPQTTELLTALKEELSERVREGVSGIVNEQIRLAWDAQPPWYNLSILRYIESRGATFVVAPYLAEWGNRYVHKTIGERDATWLHQWQVPTNMHQCLVEIAKHHVSRHVRPRLRAQIAETVELAREGRVDGLVWHSVRACKNVPSGQLDVRLAVRQALGLPGLILEGSPADPRDYSQASVERRVSTFLDQVMAHKERKHAR